MLLNYFILILNYFILILLQKKLNASINDKENEEYMESLQADY